MKSKILFTVFAFLMFLIPGAYALQFVGDCQDSNTLVITLNYSVAGSNTLIQEEPLTCPYGCIENKTMYGDDCADSPLEQNNTDGGIAIAISIILSIMSIAFIYVSVNVSDKNGVLGWFFLPLSMILMVVNLFVLSVYIANVGISNILMTTGYTIIIAMVFLFFYFMVFYFTNGFERLMNRDRERFGDKLGV